MPKKIVLYAADTAPSKALGMVAEELTRMGWDANLYARDAEIPLSTDTGLVITGMAHSAQAAETELAVLTRAIAIDVPVGLYADTFDCAGRPWFEKIHALADFVFVPTDKERTKAEAVFRNAIVTTTGNPIWEASAFPTMTRAAVRANLGLQDDHVVVFCPLRKELDINRLHLSMVDQAVRHITTQKIIPVVSIHPGDLNFKKDPKIYKNFLPHAARLLPGTPTEAILPGVDVVVNSASGAGIDAIYQRKPIVEFLPPITLDEVERLHGRRVWQPSEDKAALAVTTGDMALLDTALLMALKLMLNSEDMKKCQLMAQEEHYPLPAHPRQAIQKMAKLVEAYLFAHSK